MIIKITYKNNNHETYLEYGWLTTLDLFTSICMGDHKPSFIKKVQIKGLIIIHNHSIIIYSWYNFYDVYVKINKHIINVDL